MDSFIQLQIYSVVSYISLWIFRPYEINKAQATITEKKCWDDLMAIIEFDHMSPKHC